MQIWAEVVLNKAKFKKKQWLCLYVICEYERLRDKYSLHLWIYSANKFSFRSFTWQMGVCGAFHTAVVELYNMTGAHLEHQRMLEIAWLQRFMHPEDLCYCFLQRKGPAGGATAGYRKLVGGVCLSSRRSSHLCIPGRVKKPTWNQYWTHKPAMRSRIFRKPWQLICWVTEKLWR